ncbi:MAG: hypothetical protein A3C62_01585 [Candidatus Zambryskibacteria bacterium RIFCSPHIGHO2_02_FULL_39_16]|nr:MAG: hypothetical protein A3C62_01585 [Candidatus Zambryskibacteria bacterium RIFCSPHIGHO2_02_FULL_39_16]
MKKSLQTCIVCGRGADKRTWNNLAVLVCRNCGLTWRESFDLSEDYYVKLNEGRANLDTQKVAIRLRNSEDRFNTIRRFLPRAGICDIGCGDGSFLSILRDYGYLKCWGIEPSEYYHKMMVDRNLDVIKGEIDEILGISKRKEVHAITLFHVIEHLDDPIGSLEIMAESLRKGGILIIETPDKDASIQKATDHKNELIYPEHLFYWNEKSLCRVLQEKGFKILKISRRSFDWKHSPIKTSLMRLGMVKSLSKGNTSLDIKSQTDKDVVVIKDKGKNFFRELLRILLAYLVRILRRDDYLLIVAERV